MTAMTEREFITLMEKNGYARPLHTRGFLCTPDQVDVIQGHILRDLSNPPPFTILFTAEKANVSGEWRSFEDTLRHLGIAVPGDPTEREIFTCAECPECVEADLDDGFRCRHPKCPEDEKSEDISVFDKIPDWCPIRKNPLLLVART